MKLIEEIKNMPKITDFSKITFYIPELNGGSRICIEKKEDGNYYISEMGRSYPAPYDNYDEEIGILENPDVTFLEFLLKYDRIGLRLIDEYNTGIGIKADGENITKEGDFLDILFSKNVSYVLPSFLKYEEISKKVENKNSYNEIFEVVNDYLYIVYLKMLGHNKECIKDNRLNFKVEKVFEIEEVRI